MSLQHILTGNGYVNNLDCTVKTMRLGTGSIQNIILPNLKSVGTLGTDSNGQIVDTSATVTSGTGLFITLIASTSTLSTLISSSLNVNGSSTIGTGSFTNIITSGITINGNEIINGSTSTGTGSFIKIISGSGLFTTITSSTAIFTNGGVAIGGTNVLTNGTSSSQYWGVNPSITSDSDTLLIGSGAGSLLTSTSSNVYIGTNAAGSLIDGSGAGGGPLNVFIGANAGRSYKGGSVNTPNTIIGAMSMTNATGSFGNTTLGYMTLFKLQGIGGTSGAGNNTALGSLCMKSIITGGTNTAVGSTSMTLFQTGSQNTAIGHFSLGSCITGVSNTAIGQNSLSSLLNGTLNTALGRSAGSSYLTTESNNIVIGANGTTGDQNYIRIGSTQTGCFIQGIHGATITGSAVLVDANGQLGDIVSSQRFKKDVASIDEKDSIFSIDPKKFKYKNEDGNNVHYGFIAEELEMINKNLVLYDKENKVYSIKYHELAPLLLYEIKVLRNRVEALFGRTSPNSNKPLTY